MKKIILFVLVSNLKIFAFAQNIPFVQTPCTTTSEGKAGSFVISYTIGEMPLVTTETNSGLLLTQGILQPIKTIASTQDECFNNNEVQLYPTPTTGLFSFKINILKKGKIITQLYNALGQKIETNSFDYNTFTIKQLNISKLLAGNYYLQVMFYDENNNLKKCSYYIQKN